MWVRPAIYGLYDRCDSDRPRLEMWVDSQWQSWKYVLRAIEKRKYVAAAVEAIGRLDGQPIYPNYTGTGTHPLVAHTKGKASVVADPGQTAEHPVKAKPKRRWFQFSLRTLLVVILLFGSGFGWLGMKIKQAREQRKAVEAIRELGGSVSNDPASGGMTSAAVAFLGKLLGEDLSFSVNRVSLTSTPVTDAGLQHLHGLTQLEWLRLCTTQVSDAGLEHLRELTQLRILELQSTRVTDAGLVHLQGRTQLEHLYLGDTQVTDAGLEHLRELTQLKVLCLIGTQVTDAGLMNLRGRARLQRLYLMDTQAPRRPRRRTPGGIAQPDDLPMTEPTSTPKPQRRWFQFNLRNAA